MGTYITIEAEDIKYGDLEFAEKLAKVSQEIKSLVNWIRIVIRWLWDSAIGILHRIHWAQR